jgi:hypothetical protein
MRHDSGHDPSEDQNAVLGNFPATQLSQLQVRLSDIPVERLRSSYMYPIQNINLQP